MNMYYDFFKNLSIKDKSQLLIVVSIMGLAFSIPFGYHYTRHFFSAAAVLWIFVVNKDDLIYILKHKIVIVLIALVSLHFLSLLWSDDIHMGLSYSRKILTYIVLPVIIFSSIIKKGQLQYIITAFVFGMFVNEIISYLIYFDLYQTEYSKIYKYPVGFMYHVPYSVMVAFSALLILYQAKYLENKYLKIIYIIFFMTMTTNLVISSGRTGYVVYFGSILILLFSFYKLSIKNFLQLLLFPTIVFYIGYKLNAGVQARIEATIKATNKLQGNENYNSSLGARLASYEIVYDIFTQPENSPLYGIGVGDMKVAISKSVKKSKIIDTYFIHTHNSYLDVFLETGAIGLILLILFFYYLLRINIKDKNIRFIKHLAISVIFISMFADRLFHLKNFMFFISLFTAILLAQELNESKYTET